MDIKIAWQKATVDGWMKIIKIDHNWIDRQIAGWIDNEFLDKIDQKKAIWMYR